MRALDFRCSCILTMSNEVYITFCRLSAVAVREDETRPGPIREIPPNSRIRVCDSSLDPGMIGVEWDGGRYLVFAVDFDQRARPLATPNGHERTLRD